jgi:hypothetical protein
LTIPYICVILYTMKNVKIKPLLKKVRSKTNSDTYYTFSNWDTKEIEGVTFIPVVKDLPSEKLQHTFWLRKDNVEYVK